MRSRKSSSCCCFTSRIIRQRAQEPASCSIDDDVQDWVLRSRYASRPLQLVLSSNLTCTLLWHHNQQWPLAPALVRHGNDRSLKHLQTARARRCHSCQCKIVQDLTGAGCQTVPGAGPDLQCRTMVAVRTRSCALGPPGGRACADVQCHTACGNSVSNCSCPLGTNA